MTLTFWQLSGWLAAAYVFGLLLGVCVAAILSANGRDEDRRR